MEITPLLNLDLNTPLIYSKIVYFPAGIRENEEFLLFYELNPAQSGSIEPVKELFLLKLIYIGKKPPDTDLADADRIILPAGKYVFSQQRGDSPILNQDELLDMAVEQQKDALWERYNLKNRLYVRYLYEDNAFVTQLFREL